MRQADAAGQREPTGGPILILSEHDFGVAFGSLLALEAEATPVRRLQAEQGSIDLTQAVEAEVRRVASLDEAQDDLGSDVDGLPLLSWDERGVLRPSDVVR